MFLPPKRGAFHGSCKEVKYGPYRSHVAVYIQFIPMYISPLFLLWSSHTYPQ